MYGIRLVNAFVGSSPIRPEGWAPTGLKYRKQIMFQFCRMNDPYYESYVIYI
jgi:hypothetical protein